MTVNVYPHIVLIINHGYILKLDSLNFTNFNDYLLYNYNLLLQKYINYSTIYWYVRYIKQFYNGSLCNNYGVSIFPYINNTTLDVIKKNIIMNLNLKIYLPH